MKNKIKKTMSSHSFLDAQDSTQKLKNLDITKQTPLGEILTTNKKAAEMLFSEGLMCIGCPAAMQETLEQGLQAHGYTDKQIDNLIEKMNQKTKIKLNNKTKKKR